MGARERTIAFAGLAALAVAVAVLVVSSFVTVPGPIRSVAHVVVLAVVYSGCFGLCRLVVGMSAGERRAHGRTLHRVESTLDTQVLGAGQAA